MTGRGIAEDERPLLFEKFRQVVDRVYTKEQSERTGMGLYITRLMVEVMGGNAYLVSQNEEREVSLWWS